MKVPFFAIAVLALVPAVQAAERQAMPGHDGHGQMTHQAAAAKPATASATGTVKKLDPQKGAITIAHGPVPVLKWPAMVMPFKATAEQMEGLKAGDKVSFEFTHEGMATIVSIQGQS
ncbi:copper-binding protein [Azotobacter armeniacus]